MNRHHWRSIYSKGAFSRMRSEGFVFLSGGSGGGVVFDSFSRRVRRASASVRGVSAWAWLLGRCNSACLERVATRVCMDVSRGRRGESWQRVRGAGSRDGVSRGRRGEWCDLVRRRASFCVADAANRAQQLKPLEFVAPCEIVCVCVSGCVRRGEIMAGARNRWICGCKCGADVTQNAVAG